MLMDTSTNINELPISSQPNEISTTYNPSIVENAPLDVLQQIKDELGNITNPLPSRDIPQNTIPVVQDIQTTPNYIPQSNHMDYINSNTNSQNIISNYDRVEKFSENVHSLYEELQYPLLIGILFFLFQLLLFKILLDSILFYHFLFNRSSF